jgi:hypothetical protein
MNAMETNRNDEQATNSDEQGGVGVGAGGEPEVAVSGASGADSGAVNGPKPNNGRFTKGDRRIFKRLPGNASEEEGAAIEEEALPEVEGVPEQLLDMRHVYGRPPAADRTQAQKVCRKWMKDDPKGFMSAKTQLEGKLLSKQEAEAAKKREEESAGGQKRDGGTETALAACEKWMDNWHLEQAAEDAKLAARPDAARKSATLQNALTGSLEREAMLRAQVQDLRTAVAELKGAPRPQ